MPRSTTKSNTKKRPKVFAGTRFREKKIEQAVPEDSVTSVQSTEAEVKESAGGSSSKKLKSSNEYKVFEANEGNSFAHDIINILELISKISEIAVCNVCQATLEPMITRKGLAVSVQIQCANSLCENKIIYKNSEMKNFVVQDDEKSYETINLRMIYAMRSIGKGLSAAKEFLSLMNLPPPPAPATFQLYNKVICSAAKETCMASMASAAEEACSLSESRDLSVSLDGSWQKRGHTSLNGIISTASVDSGKVLDVQIYSKYCRCPQKDKNIHAHNCFGNFSGTSGAMEAEGALAIFQRSIEKYNVRYTSYLGDGDSKAFLKVLEQKPYGDDVEIKKLECIGHIQKRMGTRLRDLKKKKPKLSDGKAIGGRGRLTDTAILTIQRYYGLAIRRNVASLEKMKTAVWATFFHLGSTDNAPMHSLCDIEWCKYKKAVQEGNEYVHKNHFHLPKPVTDVIKPIFRDLSSPSLLEKCLSGKTQNVNESFNNFIWSKVPKNIFVWLETLQLGVYEATANFNDGNISKCKTLSSLGIMPGSFCLREMKRNDSLRIQKSGKDFLAASKVERQKRARARRKLEDEYEAQEDGPSYGYGQF